MDIAAWNNFTKKYIDTPTTMSYCVYVTSTKRLTKAQLMTTPTPLTQKLENTRPATASAATRIDLRTLASLAQFWAKKGQPLRSQSELLRVSLESFLQLLILNDEATPIETQEEALELLRRSGLAGGVKLKRTFLKGLSIEALNSMGLTAAPAEPAEDESESESEKIKRRERELQEMHEQLGIVPTKK